jgi:hypothetical protein
VAADVPDAELAVLQVQGESAAAATRQLTARLDCNDG